MTDLRPLGVEFAGPGGVIQRLLVAPQFEQGCRAVAEQDAVLRVGQQGVGVQVNGLLEVTALARRVALLHLLHELCFAKATHASSVSREASCGSGRRPGAED